MTWRRLPGWACAVVIVVATCAAYLPAMRGEFLMDDDKLVVENRLVHSSDGLYQFWCTSNAADYWPLTNSSFWLEWRLWGANPTGYHVTNLLLHLAAALLIWAILRRVGVPGAFFAALLFAVHPVNVESVAWIAQRKNTLAMVFFLLSILWYLKAEEEKRSRGEEVSRGPAGFGRWYWLSLLAFLLAMLGKGSVAVLPVLLLLVVWWQRRRINAWDMVRTAPFFLVTIVLTGVNVWFQKHGIDVVVRDVDFGQRLAGAGAVVWFYLSKAILPIHLLFVYPQWQIQTSGLLWWLPLAAALSVSVLLARQFMSPTINWGRGLLFAWLFFCVSLVPVLGFTDVGFMQYSLVADHYLHIALIGVVAIAAAGWRTWEEHTQGVARLAGTSTAVIMFAALTLLTWQQCRLYGDAASLYAATLENNPDSWLIQSNYGKALANAGRPQDAIGHYEKALRLGAHLPQKIQYNIGNALTKAGRVAEAIEHYQQALGLQPDYAEAHNNLGTAFLQAGRTQEAIDEYQQALRFRPDFPEAYNNLGVASLKLGQRAEALEHYQQALRLNPNNVEAYLNLGDLYLEMNRPLDAIEYFQKALPRQTDDARLHDHLAVALTKANRVPEAMEQYELVLRLNPDAAWAHDNLGLLLKRSGRLEEAIAHFEQAIRIQPDRASAYNNLANALFKVGRTTEAIEQCQHALQINPDLYEARYSLAVKLSKLGRLEEAVEQFERIVKSNSQDTDSWQQLAQSYAQLQRSAEAVAAAQKALALARSQGQAGLARQIDDWLTSYRAGRSKAGAAVPPLHNAP